MEVINDKKIKDKDKFNVLRPIFGEYQEDKMHFLIINKCQINKIDWQNIKPISFKSIVPAKDNGNKLVLMFAYDKELERLWNEPRKYAPLLSSAALIATPDFSVYKNMNYNEIRHNVFKNRWLGKLWQNYGCNVLPTIQRSDPSTYDVCFAGVEKGSAVIISTIGCQKNPKVFLDDFYEMKKRIQPELIIVFGKMIKGMTGKFVNYEYEEIFEATHKSKQLLFLKPSVIFELKEEN